MEAFKYRVKIEMEINRVRRRPTESFHGRKRNVHVCKLNKKIKETCERETYHILAKKNRES